MPWARVDDGFPEHRKVLDIGPVAEALWLRGLCYANRNLTDGFVPAGLVRKMGDLDGPAEAAKLVAARLWHEEEGGFRIHEYLVYQPSRADVEQLSAKRAEAGRVGGLKRAANIQAKSAEESDNEANANQDARAVLAFASSKTKQTPSPIQTNPIPTQSPNVVDLGGGSAEGGAEERAADAAPTPAKPTPSDRPVRSVPKPAKDVATPLPPDWRPPAPAVVWASLPPDDGLGLPPDFVRSEIERFIDYWTGTGGKKKDWLATWRGWMRKEAQDRRPAARASPASNGRLAPGEQAAMATERLRAKGYT